MGTRNCRSLCIGSCQPDISVSMVDYHVLFLCHVVIVCTGQTKVPSGAPTLVVGEVDPRDLFRSHNNLMCQFWWLSVKRCEHIGQTKISSPQLCVASGRWKMVDFKILNSQLNLVTLCYHISHDIIVVIE